MKLKFKVAFLYSSHCDSGAPLMLGWEFDEIGSRGGLTP